MVLDVSYEFVSFLRIQRGQYKDPYSVIESLY